MKWQVFCFLTALLLIVIPCLAQEISDAEFIAKGDAARYDAFAFKDNVCVWIEYDKDENNMLQSSIHKYNISTGMQETVIADPSGKFSVDFSGDRYVWSDQRAIYLYNETEGKLTYLSAKNPQNSPVIDGDIIVWVEDIGDKRSVIRMYNITSGEYTPVTRESLFYSSYYPAISGDKIVFVEEDIVENTRDILIYNMSETGYLCEIEDVPDVHYSPVINGDRIVWTGKYDDYYTTYMYNMTSRKKSPVNFTKSAQLCPDISGNHIVWLDFGPYPQKLPLGGDVYLHNLDTNTTEKVSGSMSKQDYPKVSGNYVVWLDSRSDAHDIYLYSFLDEGRDFSSEDKGIIPGSTPTPLPTPEKKVRYYSKILQGETEWYSLTPSKSSQLSFELRWHDNETELSMSVISPSGNIWRFTDIDDEKNDNAIRITIVKSGSYFVKDGKWNIAVSGDVVSKESDYDICWYQA
ncbi:beta propeller repeat protein [Methanomicrobium sp. W14]|uniref:hypothetical protein n=1 Tax=Methanomicrobium sp. W14 TaxID=2817839 RepID=UPI001AE81AE5|nr:hypothetical protein [Methanomicrobium sp. W14]MBP2134534.1 beta propeller repeat protein [Methanomicrobium sp. W14]